MESLTIAFVGAGNMAASIIGGLVEQGQDPALLRASDPNPVAIESLASQHGCVSCPDNGTAIAGADVAILAVKPQVMSAVLEDIRQPVAENSPLVISIAAGITIESMEQGLGENTAIVRCMPNTPALLGAGATGLFANKACTPSQEQQATQILGAVGSVSWVKEEALLDAVTALSGSGPAYFFLFMEAMIDAGESLGLDRETSTALALQTGLGATRMAAESEFDLVELRRRVTSPAGTTEKAVESFEQSGLRDIVDKAMAAASQRAEELGKELG